MQRFKILILCAAAPLFALAQKEEKPNFKLSGTLVKVPDEISKVYLSYIAGGKRVMDSSEVKEGKYSFSGVLAEPFQASLFAKGNQASAPLSRTRSAINLFIEPSTAIIVASTDSFSNAKISGSKSNVAFEALNKQLKPYSDQMAALNTEYRQLYQQKDEEGIAKLREKAEVIEKEQNTIYKNYVEKNPSSPIALFALTNYAGYDIDPAKVGPLFAKLPASTKNTPAGKSLASKLEIAEKTAVGKPAIEFTQNDTLGNPVSLASFKGKYVLVDFWASWCGPCRQENPNVVNAYNAYKEKGFTVLGVSLDREGQKDKWLDAIHKDGLTWTHVSDLQFWNNAVAKSYGIQSIPQNLLIDPKGVIIAKNLRGEALQSKLAELLH